MALLLAATFKHSFWIFARRFGAFAFFPLGLLDMSLIPAPGSFDALLILLTATHKEWWWYYALMATAGSVFGAWPTFRIGQKGGEETLEKRLGPSRSKKVFTAFRRWGFWSMFVGAVAPPPMPASAFVLAAGSLDYPWHRFLLSWTFGRIVRFGLLSWITAQYGSHIFHWFRIFYWPVLWTLIGLGVVGGGAALWFYLRGRRRRAPSQRPDHRAA